MKEELCGCQDHPAQGLHTCPYLIAVHHDFKALCDCCTACTRNCQEDIELLKGVEGE